jgi:ATP-dependent Lon protease
MNKDRDEKRRTDFMSKMLEEGSFIIEEDIEEEADIKSSDKTFPEVMPVLPLRNTLLFPGVVMPVMVGREKSLNLLHEVEKDKLFFAVVAQKDIDTENPGLEDLHKIGTIAKVLKVIELPDGSTSAIIKGYRRMELEDILLDEPFNTGKVKVFETEKILTGDNEYDAISSSLKDNALKIIKHSSNIPSETGAALDRDENSHFLINFISANTDIEFKDKLALLEIEDTKERAIMLLSIVTKQVQILELKADIQKRVRVDMDKQQRDYILNQQIRTIQDELGDNPGQETLIQLRDKASDKKWNDTVAEYCEKEIEKLERMNPSAPDYGILLSYIEELLDLPWNEYTADNFDLKRAQKVLDSDHFGLEKVKDRILEHLAVLKLKGDLKSPILCLYGPPGVGKTSLGKSIAEALDRKYVRMSLGGLHDESEIRGHRRTYMGAMPGRILKNLKKAGSANPVFILDEIDKVNSDFKGDPQSALLEVLDPEQNESFHDNYIDQDFDLSKVLFIATANDISNIAPPLRDRMEMIDISGYLLEEKIEIAKKHLLPKQLKNHGLKPKDIKVNKAVFELIIDKYTRESGVRALDKTLAKLVRQIAKNVAMEINYEPKIQPKDLKGYLGREIFSRDAYQGNEFAGVVTGLAWTSVGGEILFIESSLSRGKGTLTLTGNLGDVMKESATIALEYIKANAHKLNIKPEIFEKYNIHIHVPEGATPKDGPSAGVTMATSLASSLTQRKLREKIAMTGEITLRGKVLPVGGIKEKILAAKRAGITDIIICKDNQRDIEDIKEVYIKGLTFHYVENVMDVLKIALLDEKVEDPIKF